jgi:hypothetical protein
VQHRNATAAVIGAGDYIGGAIAKKFAAEGFTVFAGRRQGDKLAPLVAEVEANGGKISARSLDARKEDDLTAFLQDADKQAPLEVCVFNIGANVNFPLLETTDRLFRKVWEMACYSGFVAGREAARLMLPRGRGAIFFTGATASVRGGEIRPARSCAKRRTGTRAEEYPRRASDHRRGRRHGLGARSNQGTRGRRSDEELRRRATHAARRCGRNVLATLSAAARRVDLRAGDSSLRRKMVKPWSR